MPHADFVFVGLLVYHHRHLITHATTAQSLTLPRKPLHALTFLCSCQSTLFVAFVVYDTRRQEAGRLDCFCCVKTKNMDKRPSVLAAANVDANTEWVSPVFFYLGCICLF